LLPLGFIYDQKKQRQRWRELPVDYVIPHHSLVTRELVDQVHDAGKKLFVWTVNGKAPMLRFAGWDVDGIISDKTELLAGTFRG
jgi:glycerophosphoryl diester phosphodiesterase